MEEKNKKNLLNRIISEYKDVTWADKNKTFQVTVIVLLITFFVALMVTIFDFSLKYLLDTLSNLLRKVF